MAISFILAVFSGLSVRAEGASLYLSPNSGTFFVGSTFDVSVFLNTGGNNINAVRVDLKFDPKKVQIASPTAGKSFISVWVAQPVYSNVNGTASFQGGMPSPGINTSSGLVSTITFRAMVPGETVISFSDSSKILLDDGKGTNVLSSLGRGVYRLTIPPPEGPEVFSPTHPDQNKWYGNNSPTLSWKKEEDITGFSYDINKNLFSDIDNISEGMDTSISYSDLEDGIWYFHVKAKKGNIWGGISHYIMQIDKTSPASFQLSFRPTLSIPSVVSQEPILTFMTTDNLSGVSHYSLKLINLSNALEKKEDGFFVEISSPYKLPRLNPGEYEVVVRAFDNALNSADSAKKIEVIPTDRFIYFFKMGVSIYGWIIEWPVVILILTILIAVLALIVYLEIKHHLRLRKAEKAFRETEEKLRKNKEEISKKLYE